MGVGVDDAGRHERAGGVDDLLAVRHSSGATSTMTAATYPHVRRERRRAGAVHDLAALDQDVSHRPPPHFLDVT